MQNQLKSNHGNLTGHSVLIIDDDQFTLGAMSGFLGKMGLEILVARDGRSGFEKACYAQPDLILLDVRLPGADGFEICDRLKVEETTKEIPVIFMTALTKTEHKIKGFNAGGVDYITKPLQFEEVLARVATHIQLDDLRQSLQQKVSERTALLTSTVKKLEQEIAQHQQTAAALKESEARYRCLFEESPISLWEEDFTEVQHYLNRLRASGITDFREYFRNHPEDVSRCAKLVKVRDVNKAALESMGAGSKEQLMGGLIDLFTKDSLEVFREELVTLAQGRVKFQSEAVHRTLTGDETHVVLCLRVAPGYETSLSKVMISFLDITDRKRAEEKLARQKDYLLKQASELARAKEEADAVDRAKYRFLSNISHELRTPLNPILGYSQLLIKQPNLTEDQRQQINDIHSSGKHLLVLIEDIINYCHDGGLSSEPIGDEFNLAHLIDAVKTEASDKAAAKKLAFHYEEPIPIPHRVYGPELKLKQVLSKILDNAVKFTNQGRITFRVICAEMGTSPVEAPDQPRQCRIQFQVEDTGPGISKDKLPTIFESFTQAPSKGQLIEGVGLGLSICRQLVEQMGGTIAVKSDVGKGSLFTVAFDLELAV